MQDKQIKSKDRTIKIKRNKFNVKNRSNLKINEINLMNEIHKIADRFY